ncbi:MAG TPA: hypothetical protein GX510_06910 [Firmicutes bacterium]|nr:hypothetical protein [Candidatus Fermentithermobacillaceae bacterium]
MPRLSTLAILAVVLALLILSASYLGCTPKVEPVPVEESLVPEGIKKHIQEELERSFFWFKDLKWYVLEECEGGVLAIAAFQGATRSRRIPEPGRSWYVWGYFQQVPEGSETKWVRVTITSDPLAPEGRVFGGGWRSVGQNQYCAAGWVLDSRAARAVLARTTPDGKTEEFPCTVKNGFWWTGPHAWGSYWPDRAIVYSDSGKILYDGKWE